MPRFLIVANRSLAGPDLIEEVLARQAADNGSVFHVVVPATRIHSRWSEGQAAAHARDALADASHRFAEAGVTVTGEVGDESPMLAVGDALRREPFDAIIVSTLPAGPSRWLKRDLPRRLEHEYELPVTHVVSELQPAR